MKSVVIKLNMFQFKVRFLSIRSDSFLVSGLADNEIILIHIEMSNF